MQYISLADAIALFMASTPESPVDITYMHYSRSRRTSRGIVRVPQAVALPMGDKGRDAGLLMYRPAGINAIPIKFYVACFLSINGRKVTFSRV